MYASARANLACHASGPASQEIEQIFGATIRALCAAYVWNGRMQFRRLPFRPLQLHRPLRRN